MTAPWASRPVKPPPVDPITDSTRRLVKARSKGRCELCGGPGQHLHHRQLRRAGDHSAANLVDVCLHCHRRIHNHVTWSNEHGWLVSQFRTATDTPILMRDNNWYLLATDGWWEQVDAPF